MDDGQTRDYINQHADAVVRGDMDAILADFSEEMRPGAPQIVNDVLPQPVTAAEVLNIDVGDSEAVAMIRYSGDGELTAGRAGRTRPAGR